MNVRVQEALAMMMIGDGVLAASHPKEHCAIWLRGPRQWERGIRWFVEHPQITRAFGMAEVIAGLWWSSRLRDVTAVDTL